MCLIHEVGDLVGFCYVIILIGDLSLCHFSWFHELTGLSWLVLTWHLSVRRFLSPLKASLGCMFKMTSLTHWDGYISQGLARHLSPGSLSMASQPGSLRQLSFLHGKANSFLGEQKVSLLSVRLRWKLKAFL